MACSYRIVLVLDGGSDALLVPIVGLNYLSSKIGRDQMESSLYSWLDLIVASGDSILLGSLLAQGKSEFINETIKLEDFLVHQNNGYNPELLNTFFSEDTTLYDLRKHFLFLSYDVDSDEIFQFSDSKPTLQNTSMQNLLKACMGNPSQQQFVKLGNKRLMNASKFVPNPVLQAGFYANCLYHEDPIVIVSIGSGRHSTVDTEQLYSQEVQREFSTGIKDKRRWHYFRFNPEFEPNDSMEVKIEKTRTYFERESTSMERLLKLMEIKAGGIL